jgi:sulfite reductase beta subunit-like hemoprotein
MMATRIKPAPKELYEEDFYVWTQRQAELLRARRFADLDLEHLIEEVAELGDTKLSAVLNNARVVMEHLLKLQHSPATDPRNGWRATVREHRSRLEIELTPRLREIVQQELPRVFRIARKSAAESMRDHGEHGAADALPETCPYTADQITGDWLP